MIVRPLNESFSRVGLRYASKMISMSELRVSDRVSRIGNEVGGDTRGLQQVLQIEPVASRSPLLDRRII